MSPDEPAPPPHVMSLYRLSMLTTAGAPAHQVGNQVNGMVAAWRTELADDQAELRTRLDGMEATLRSSLDTAERQAAALRAALDAAAQARSELARAELARSELGEG